MQKTASVAINYPSLGTESNPDCG